MSRIGRLPITVPAGVEVKVDGSVVRVKGTKGELNHTVASPIEVTLDADTLTVARPNDERASRSLHGLTRTLISNMIELEFQLGYSHPIIFDAPDGITFAVETPTKLSVSGINKQQVGEVAANIRKLRKPDPYKGKGIRYAGEVIRRKVGKAGK